MDYTDPMDDMDRDRVDSAELQSAPSAAQIPQSAAAAAGNNG